MERPGKVVPPKRLLQGFLEVLELVGYAAWPAGILNWGVWWGGWALGHRMRQRGALKVLIQEGGFANALARAGVLVHPATGQPNQRAKVRNTHRPEEGKKKRWQISFSSWTIKEELNTAGSKMLSHIIKDNYDKTNKKSWQWAVQATEMSAGEGKNTFKYRVYLVCNKASQ